MYQFNNNKGFGIEIEFIRPNHVSQQEIANKVDDALVQVNGGCNLEAYNHITRPQWKLVTDSSVHSQAGYRGDNELVSPILRGYNGKKQLQIVLDTLKALGCKVNTSCGIHVHHDVTDTMVDTKENVTKFLNNLIKFVCKFEHLIYRIVSPSRLTGIYCNPARSVFGKMRNAGLNNTGLKLITKRIFKDLKESVDYKYRNYGSMVSGRTMRFAGSSQTTRYCGLNLRNIWTRGSVEFRYMQGSLNFNKIWSWVVLTQAIINVTETTKSVAFKSVKNDLTGMFYFRKALGFIGNANRCEDTKKANSVTLKRYKELSKPELENSRRNSRYYQLTMAGV
tara:strand:+ start:14013 stop:15020 length:1008 start_codon:yes stop_codon:yes gene_type:complete